MTSTNLDGFLRKGKKKIWQRMLDESLWQDGDNEHDGIIHNIFILNY